MLADVLNSFITGQPMPDTKKDDIIIKPKKETKTDKFSNKLLFAEFIYNISKRIVNSVLFGIGIMSLFSYQWNNIELISVGYVAYYFTSEIFSKN